MVDYVEYTKVWVNGQNGRGYYKNEAATKQFDGRKMMDIECVAYTSAKGSEEVLESSPVSIRLAIQEGWFTKNGSKWQTMTKTDANVSCGFILDKCLCTRIVNGYAYR